MSREHAIRHVLADGPMQLEAILLVMGGDRDEVRASLKRMMGEHEIYWSRGWLQLNRPERQAAQPQADVARPNHNFSALQASW